PYSVPEPADLPGRLEAVMAVAYLIFTEGHAATHGDAPIRADLCAEAIRLARLLVRLFPEASEARGLLARLLLTDARRQALLDALEARGELVDYQLLSAARGDLFRRAGRFAEAAVSYRRAISLGGNEAERRFLERRLREVSEAVVAASEARSSSRPLRPLGRKEHTGV